MEARRTRGTGTSAPEGPRGGPGASRQGQTWLHFTCLQEASVLPSVCPSARPPPFTSSLGMVNSSSSCCSSVKFGFGAVSLWPFSRQSEGSTPLLAICVAGEAPAAFPEPGSELCGDVAVPPARGSGAAADPRRQRSCWSRGRTDLSCCSLLPVGFLFPFLAG